MNGFTWKVGLFCRIYPGALMFPWYLLCIPTSIFGPETSNTVSALYWSLSAPVCPQALAVLCNHPELTFPEGTGKPRHEALFSIMSMFIKAPRCAGWTARFTNRHNTPMQMCVCVCFVLSWEQGHRWWCLILHTHPQTHTHVCMADLSRSHPQTSFEDEIVCLTKMSFIINDHLCLI